MYSWIIIYSFLKYPHILGGQLGDRLYKLSDEGSAGRDFVDLSKWHLLYIVGYFVIYSEKGPAVEGRPAYLNKRSDLVRSLGKRRKGRLKRGFIQTTQMVSDMLVLRRIDLGAIIDSPSQMTQPMQVVRKIWVLKRTVLERSIDSGC